MCDQCFMVLCVSVKVSYFVDILLCQACKIFEALYILGLAVDAGIAQIIAYFSCEVKFCKLLKICS